MNDSGPALVGRLTFRTWGGDSPSHEPTEAKLEWACKQIESLLADNARLEARIKVLEQRQDPAQYLPPAVVDDPVYATFFSSLPQAKS